MRRGLISTALMGLMLVILTAACSAQDRVDRKRGGPLIGKVKSEDYREVKLKARRGGERSIPADQVLDVVRGDAPEPYLRGRVALQKSDLQNAVNLMTLASVEGKQPWVQEYATFYLAEALRASGKYGDAVSAYGRVLGHKADSRFLPRVRLGIARAYAAEGRTDKAIKTLEAFITEVDTKTLSVTFSLDAKILLGSLLGRQNLHGQAAAALEGVVRTAEGLRDKAKDDETRAGYAELVLKSKRNLGASYIKAKKYGQAEATYAAIAADAKDPVAQAIAEIGRAEVNLARGQVDLARVQLTNVLAVRFAAEGERPRAMWLLAQAYGELHKKGEKGARAHGRRYLKDLVKHYPGSDLAAQARKLLK